MFSIGELLKKKTSRMDFKAAMFDFDGTVTEKGVYAPSQEVADGLVRLALKMPIAFCTGRQIESFERRGLGALLQEIKPNQREGFLKNLFLMAENGSIGYYFDSKVGHFEEFYKADWPEEFYSRMKLMMILDDAVKTHGSVLYDAHRVVIVIGTRLNSVVDGGNAVEVYKLSSEIFEIVTKLLMEISPDYEKYVHIGNSGIGVIVSPSDSDKDFAILKFSKYLKKYRKFSFENGLKDILIVGDQPLKNGNDHYFLSGKYGTPYSVGEESPMIDSLKYVFDKAKDRLFHSKAVIQLISTIL